MKAILQLRGAPRPRVVIEHKRGAGGNLGAQAVLDAPPRCRCSPRSTRQPRVSHL